MSQLSNVRNASDWGLIIQGLLIFLSAVIGVVGYYVQGRLKSKEKKEEELMKQSMHIRELKLKKINEKLMRFLAPCSQLCFNLQTHKGYFFDYAEKCYPEEWARYKVEKDKRGSYGKGEYNKSFTFVGEEIEKIMKDNPQSEFSKRYRQNMKVLVYSYAMPINDLIQQYGQSLSIRGDKDAYKKRFPCVANNGLLRNVFITQMCRWACEFKAIIEEEWDKGIYDTVFTVINPYPEQVLRHFLGQLSEIRELENEYGIDKNKIFLDSGSSNEPPSNKKTAEIKKTAKYAVVGGIAGTAGAIVAVANNN
jgi:hypothetical protein